MKPMSKLKRLWLGLALVCTTAWAAIAVDVAIGAGWASSTTTVSSADATVSSTADRYAYGLFATRDFTTGSAHSSLTLESVSMTQVGTTQGWYFGLGNFSAWGLLNPAAGTLRTLQGTAAATQNNLGTAGIVYNGVHQTTPTRDNDQLNGSCSAATSVSPSLTMTTVSGDRVAASVVLSLETPGAVTLSGETSRLESTSSDLTIVIVDKVASGASTTITPTLSFATSNCQWAIHGIVLIPAAEAGGSLPKQTPTLGAG